jgi:Ca2+-binding RTX toxin-like protein
MSRLCSVRPGRCGVTPAPDAFDRLIVRAGGSGTMTVAPDSETTPEATLVIGSNGADSILGTADTDFLVGGKGNDTLDGGASDDVVFGGEGNDLLKGGAGIDILMGGAGKDTADYSGGYGAIAGLNSSGEFRINDQTGATDTLTGVEKILLKTGSDTLSFSAPSGMTYVGNGGTNNASYSGVHVYNMNTSEVWNMKGTVGDRFEGFSSISIPTHVEEVVGETVNIIKSVVIPDFDGTFDNPFGQYIVDYSSVKGASLHFDGHTTGGGNDVI